MLARKICKLESCGRSYIAVRPNQKFCCKFCRLTYNEQKNRAVKKKESHRQNSNTGQICWRCQRACGSCSWSRELKPVEGWDAKVTVIKSNGVSEYNSYKIISCPMFLADIY